LVTAVSDVSILGGRGAVECGFLGDAGKKLPLKMPLGYLSGEKKYGIVGMGPPKKTGGGVKEGGALLPLKIHPGKKKGASL